MISLALSHGVPLVPIDPRRNAGSRVPHHVQDSAASLESADMRARQGASWRTARGNRCNTHKAACLASQKRECQLQLRRVFPIFPQISPFWKNRDGEALRCDESERDAQTEISLRIPHFFAIRNRRPVSHNFPKFLTFDETRRWETAVVQVRRISRLRQIIPGSPKANRLGVRHDVSST
jgi:hypothetical protein